MPKQATPWFREQTGWWYVTLAVDGTRRQVRLAEGRANRAAAVQRWHELLAVAGPGKKTAGSRSAGSFPTSPEAAGPLTVFGVCQRFLSHTAANNAPATYELYRGFLTDFQGYLAADIPAEAIRPHHVQGWLDSVQSWGPSSRNLAVRTVRRAFRWAVESGLMLGGFPLTGLRAPTPARREVILTDEDFAALLAAAGDDGFRDLLRLVWHTGCRPQEATAIEARHCDWPNSRVVVPGSEAKGGRVRVIWLDETAGEILRRLAVTLEEKGLAGPLLRNSRGAPWTRNATRCRFRRLFASRKLPRRWCLYQLRHSWATRALARGVDPVTVSILMGHASATTVAETYQHLAAIPEHMKDAARKATSGTK